MSISACFWLARGQIQSGVKLLQALYGIQIVTLHYRRNIWHYIKPLLKELGILIVFKKWLCSKRTAKIGTYRCNCISKIDEKFKYWWRAVLGANMQSIRSLSIDQNKNVSNDKLLTTIYHALWQQAPTVNHRIAVKSLIFTLDSSYVWKIKLLGLLHYWLCFTQMAIM